MKKLVLFVVALLVATSLFASFSLSFGPHEPFFASFQSELLSSSVKLGAFKETEAPMEGQFIRFDKKAGVPGEYYASINDYNADKDTFFLNLQAGGGASILRFGFPGYVEMDFMADAHFNSVFYLLRGNDLLGVDGVYFMGAEAKLFDSVMLRGGFRHFSGHIGDEALDNAYRRDPSFLDATMTEVVWDSYEITLGCALPSFPYLKAASGLIIPAADSYLMPFVHRPDWILSGGKTNAERDPDAYAVRGDYGEGYNALTVFGEVDASLPLSWGGIYLSYILKAYETGKTNHTLTPLDDTESWQLDHEVKLGVEAVGEKHIAKLELFFRVGRFPLLNMYWRESTMAGFSFTFR